MKEELSDFVRLSGAKCMPCFPLRRAFAVTVEFNEPIFVHYRLRPELRRLFQGCPRALQ